MQQPGGDYSSSAYYPHVQFSPSVPIPNPNPSPYPVDIPPSAAPLPPPFASAPPYHYPAYSNSPDPASFVAPQTQTPPKVPPFQPCTTPSYAPQQPGAYPHLQQPYAPYEINQPPVPKPYPSYDSHYDQGGYFDGNAAGYGPGTAAGGYRVEGGGYMQDYYERKDDSVGRYEPPMPSEDVFGDGVYAYQGGSVEPYGARGTKSASSFVNFDDYGRALGLSQGDQGRGNVKVVRAVPKVEAHQDVNHGVQKFRVKLLPEGAGSPQDVLCQVGLDGIRMLDPSTSRTLRIYPLDTITRCQVLDSSIFAFWAKSSVDIESRRIRLQSNSYTSNTILDTVTAATVQYKEMGGKDAIRSNGTADHEKLYEQIPEKKKGLMDWMSKIKPANEEKDHWVPDEAVTKCTSCRADFGAFVRRHHCRNCGDIFCDKCSSGRIALTADEQAQPVRVCDGCLAEVTQRLSRAKDSLSRPTSELQSHADLAKKLQDEMERNRKAGSKSSSGSAIKMREVACPTCTVHLQVQVPSYGSETIECGVCQSPFLVSAS